MIKKWRFFPQNIAQKSLRDILQVCAVSQRVDVAQLEQIVAGQGQGLQRRQLLSDVGRDVS